MEIAKQEAQTVKRGGANNPYGCKGSGINVSNTHVDSTASERNSNTGLLRRLAKQGRDDLLERVAIAKAIEEEIKAQGERRGNPAFTSIPGDCPELDGNETRAIAAEKAGFKSDRTYRRAKKALDIFPAAVAN